LPEARSAREDSDARKPGAATVERDQRRVNSRFLRACRGESVDRTPIWLMRQAGRFIPEFRAIRAKTSFLDLCKTSELACEVTVMAVEMFQLDAAIIFADILLPLEPLGVGLQYLAGEGPHIERPIRTPEDVEALRPCHAENDLGYVLDAIRLTRRELNVNTPLIGFAGAPFTLASYMIEGGSSKNFEKTKTFMYTQPKAWHQLMQRIAQLTAEYLNAQVAAGAEALQLFDSWVGCLSPSDYAEFVLPYSKQVIDTVSGAPLIHFGTGTGTLLPQMVQAGGDVIGVDWRIGLDTAWKTIGSERGIQGNLDPMVLLSTPEEIERQAGRILREAGGRTGHIFNLGHGVLPPTNPDNVRFLVDFVHNYEVPPRD
jgi:uroporphyrinogen decarboxylase